ncbi:MAG: helix-turn-helix domain-containing protein [Lachnospirales bacterium]
MNIITQKVKYSLSLIKYAKKYGVTKAAIKYNTNRQYIYRWLKRYDGSNASLRNKSTKPHHHQMSIQMKK